MDDSTIRLTSELAVKQIGNRYDTVLVAAQRLRELHRGDAALVSCTEGMVTTVLKEIEQGKVGREYLLKNHGREHRRQKHQGI
jgi:DNA-directed RNA polymerase subunit omega